MSNSIRRFLIWAPRVVGILAAAFLGVFALDVFSEGRSIATLVPALLLHLVPSLILIAVVAVAWHRPLAGAIVFFSLAAIYGASTRSHPSWILVIGGPLALTALLYVASWRVLRHASS